MIIIVVSSNKKNVQNLNQYPGFKLIKASIQDLDWQELLQSVDVVYHQAAQAGVRASWGKDFHHYTERNINATQVILEGAKQVKSLKRIVYASSSSIYGNAATMPTPETLCPQPVSPYGITKTRRRAFMSAVSTKLQCTHYCFTLFYSVWTSSKT